MTPDLLLVIDHRETQVRMASRALRIDRPESPPEHIPLGLIGLVVIHGSPMVACDVWRELAERNIPAVVQPARGRGQSALIGAALGSTIELRIAQHRAAADPKAAVAIARRLVAAKIEAQSEVRVRLAPAGDPGLALARLQHASVGNADTARTGPSLMGVEGAAAAAWYEWLSGWLPSAWRFAGRNRRPPRDPVNALLSLGYTLLAGEMLRAVQEQGLDPALGYLHSVVPGRESLVLDLMEPLRPTVDLVVIGLLDNVLVPTHFTYSDRDGCRLNKSGRAQFYREWAIARGDWPDLDAAAPTGPAAEPPPREQAPETPPSNPGTGSAPPVSLPSLCRRQVDRLRVWLRPYLNPVVPDEDIPF